MKNKVKAKQISKHQPVLYLDVMYVGVILNSLKEKYYYI